MTGFYCSKKAPGLALLFARNVEDFCKFQNGRNQHEEIDLARLLLEITRNDAYHFLQECRKAKCLKLGRQVQSLIIFSGHDSIAVLGDHLIKLFSDCGTICEANQSFDRIAETTAYTWAAIISAHVDIAQGFTALELYYGMRQSCVKNNTHSSLAILKACTLMKAIYHGRIIHGQIIRDGLQLDVYLGSTLIHMYATCLSLRDSCEVFDKLVNQNVVTWNAIIAGYVYCGQGHLGFEFLDKIEQDGIEPDIISWNSVILGYSQHNEWLLVRKCLEKMQRLGMEPDKFTFSSVLKACANERAIEQGRIAHSQIIERRLDSDVVVANSMLHMYVLCGNWEEATKILMKMPNRDVVSWNAMIAGYVQHGKTGFALDCFEQMQKEGVKPDLVSWNAMLAGYVQDTGLRALGWFAKMQQEGIAPNEVTYSTIIKACTNMGAIKQGRIIHEQIIECGCQSDVIVGNALVHMYMTSGHLEDAGKVFDELPSPDVVSWNTMIAGYAQNGKHFLALKCFETMQQEGVLPDVVSWNALIAGYTLQGKGVMALQCLEEMQGRGIKPNIISWNTIISGYAQSGDGKRALECFTKMQQLGITPNEVTFSSILRACASIGALRQGICIHGQIVKSYFQRSIVVGNALVDMYAKCGYLREACKVFDGLSIRDIIAWNAMITGYAQNGDGLLALDSCKNMQKEGLMPDEGTLTSVLLACSHAGLVDEGCFYLNVMARLHGVRPTMFHFTCVIDLLGRAGFLEEAEDILKATMEADFIGWISLLNSCRIHADCVLGKRCCSEIVHLSSLLS